MPLTCPISVISLRQLVAKTSSTADEQQEIANLKAALRKAEEKGAALARELAARERDLVRMRETEEVAALRMAAMQDARASAELQLSQTAGQLLGVQEQLSGKRKRCDELENNLSVSHILHCAPIIVCKRSFLSLCFLSLSHSLYLLCLSFYLLLADRGCGEAAAVTSADGMRGLFGGRPAAVCGAPARESRP
jgi:hypothetical protein